MMKVWSSDYGNSLCIGVDLLTGDIIDPLQGFRKQKSKWRKAFLSESIVRQSKAQAVDLLKARYAALVTP